METGDWTLSQDIVVTEGNPLSLEIIHDDTFQADSKSWMKLHYIKLVVPKVKYNQAGTRSAITNNPSTVCQPSRAY